MSARDIFATETDEFTRYEATLVVRDKIIGGVPKDPDTILKWLRSRLEMEDRAIIELAEETAAAMQTEAGERPAADELLAEVARKFEGGNGFKSANGQLVYEGRCMKAALKEAANVAYPGTNWPGKPAGIWTASSRRARQSGSKIEAGVSHRSEHSSKCGK